MWPYLKENRNGTQSLFNLFIIESQKDAFEKEGTECMCNRSMCSNVNMFIDVFFSISRLCCRLDCYVKTKEVGAVGSGCND